MKMFKYIDIASFKTETYFSRISPLTSAANDMSAQETIAYMNTELTYFKCEKLCVKIQKSIKAISDSSSCIKDVLPDDIVKIGSAAMPLNPDRLESLLPFFEWLKQLISDNSNMKTLCKAEARHTASHFSEPFSSFIEALSSVSVTHRITCARNENNKIHIKTVDRLWGHAGFSAENAVCEGEIPSFGTLEWFEAEENDGIFTFRFLINENFSDAAVDILNDNSYNAVRITSEKPKFFSRINNCFDFVKSSGASARKSCALLLSELCGKTDTLGDGILNAEEKSLLPLARLYRAVNIENKTISVNKSNISEIFDIIENRFLFDRAMKMLEASDYDSVKEFAKTARAAASSIDRDDIPASVPHIKHFFRYFNLFFRQDSQGRFELADCVLKCFKDAFSRYNDESEYISCFGSAVNAFREPLERKLFANGFSGEFPNYQRIKDNVRSVFTVGVQLGSYTPKFGDFTFKFSFALAQYNTESSKIPKNTNAADLSESNCKRTEIASELDGGELNLVYNMYNSKSNLENVYPESIEKFVDTAIAAFDGKPIPDFYKREHLKKLHKNSVWRSILNLLPFIAFAASIFLVGAKIFFNTVFASTVTLPIFICGVVLCILAAGFTEKIRSKFSIWKN